MKNYIAEKVKEFRLIIWGEAPTGSLKYKKGKEIESFLTKALEETAEKAYKEGQKDILNQFIGEIEKHKSNQKDVVLKTTEFRELVYKNLDQLTKETK